MTKRLVDKHGIDQQDKGFLLSILGGARRGGKAWEPSSYQRKRVDEIRSNLRHGGDAPIMDGDDEWGVDLDDGE